MDGRRAARIIRKLWPQGAKIVAITAYAPKIATETGYSRQTIDSNLEQLNAAGKIK